MGDPVHLRWRLHGKGSQPCSQREYTLFCCDASSLQVAWLRIRCACVYAGSLRHSPVWPCCGHCQGVCIAWNGSVPRPCLQVVFVSLYNTSTISKATTKACASCTVTKTKLRPVSASGPYLFTLLTVGIVTFVTEVVSNMATVVSQHPSPSPSPGRSAVICLAVSFRLT